MSTHLLTGAGSGIGAALADALHTRGDSLVLVVRSQGRAEELAARYEGASLLVADLADPISVEGLDLPGSLDSLVHCAGAVDLGTVAHLTTAQWREQIDVNLLAPASLSRVALPALRAARGTVVFLNSGAGLRTNPEWAAYAASKHGLRALADAMRAEERAAGVRVSSLYAGRTATPMQQKVHGQEGREYDPGEWIRPGTVVDTILHVLDLPGDATIPDITLSPGP